MTMENPNTCPYCGDRLIELHHELLPNTLLYHCNNTLVHGSRGVTWEMTELNEVQSERKFQLEKLKEKFSQSDFQSTLKWEVVDGYCGDWVTEIGYYKDSGSPQEIDELDYINQLLETYQSYESSEFDERDCSGRVSSQSVAAFVIPGTEFITFARKTHYDV